MFGKVINIYTAMALFYTWEAYRVYTQKSVSAKVKEKIQGEKLQVWCISRIYANIISAVGFFSFSLSEILPVDVTIKLIINVVAITLFSIGPIISIRNNIKNLGYWSSTFM